MTGSWQTWLSFARSIERTPFITSGARAYLRGWRLRIMLTAQAPR